jgi:hypothetical protein
VGNHEKGQHSILRLLEMCWGNAGNRTREALGKVLEHCWEALGRLLGCSLGSSWEPLGELLGTTLEVLGRLMESSWEDVQIISSVMS